MARSASLLWTARLPGPIHPAAVAAAVLLHLLALGVLLRAGHVVSPPPPVMTLALTMPQVQSLPAQSASPPPTAAPPPPPPVQTTPAPSVLTPLTSADSAAPEEAPARTGQVPPPPVQAAQAPRERTTTSHPLPRREAAPREAPSPAAPAPPAAAPPSASAASAASASWQVALSAWLQAHKFYPERARRRGEQGTVVLRFTAERDGRVLHVALVEPSGSRILDNAALSMLRDAHIPPFPATMPQQQITLTLPVRYALQP
jgi:protein TonB